MTESTLHIVGLPHTETTQDYNQCAYTSKVRKFATMMTTAGHRTILYSSGHNEAACTDHVQVLTSAAQAEQFRSYPWWRNREWFQIDWSSELPYWQVFNNRVIDELRLRVEPKDILCLITGYPQRDIMAAFPAHMSVEYGIGYEGVYAPYRVYESYAWMHCLYGKQGPSAVDGRFYDAVIPNYYECAEFPVHCAFESDPYFLFMSRMIPRKGYEIAVELTRRLGVPLVVAGTGGDRPQHDHVTYTGYANTERRGALMAGAQALLCPTLYIEPFGGVTVEANLCGTPVLTTDWGAFTETVTNGIDGFRCRNLAEFEHAALQLGTLDPSVIRQRAQDRFSTDVVAEQFTRYFERLAGLWDEGFYASMPTSTVTA